MNKLDELLKILADGSWEKEWQIDLSSVGNPGWNIKIPSSNGMNEFQLDRVSGEVNTFLIFYSKDGYNCGSCAMGRLDDLIDGVIERLSTR